MLFEVKPGDIVYLEPEDLHELEDEGDPEIDTALVCVEIVNVLRFVRLRCGSFYRLEKMPGFQAVLADDIDQELLYESQEAANRAAIARQKNEFKELHAKVVRAEKLLFPD